MESMGKYNKQFVYNRFFNGTIIKRNMKKEYKDLMVSYLNTK
jgi:hypothetical protein